MSYTTNFIANYLSAFFEQVLFWRRLSVCLCVCLSAQNLENY